MKFISVTILFICLTAATFSKWFMIACFDLNENYVAKELCVNKNNPTTHCNGHCYLNKQLNNEEKPNAPLNNSSKEKFEVQLFCINALTNINIVSCFMTTSYTSLQSFSAQKVFKAIFHPPAMT